MHEQRETLQQLWLKYARGIGVVAQSIPLLTELIAAWSETHRRYHTLRHLQECLLHLERWGREHPRRCEIGIALWFHDAAYDTTRQDNEDRSARWAQRSLSGLEADPEKVGLIARMVRATKHRPKARLTADLELMLDIDLAILGADRARFEEYERQVRAEYAHVPDGAFAQGRAAFVDAMLQRQRLFHTAVAHNELEARARENLARSSQHWRAQAAR
jgi:predicted metal-dependent HD superfamily phosphohydrolase